VSQFGLERSHYPTVFMLDLPNERYFMDDNFMLHNEEDVIKFLQDVRSGVAVVSFFLFHSGRLFFFDSFPYSNFCSG
jgi:hypothetical protein